MSLCGCQLLIHTGSKQMSLPNVVQKNPTYSFDLHYCCLPSHHGIAAGEVGATVPRSVPSLSRMLDCEFSEVSGTPADTNLECK